MYNLLLLRKGFIMLNTILEAAKNFCVHQIQTDYTIKQTISKMSTFIAYIDIDTNTNQKYRVYIAADKNFIQKVATLFLDEACCDDDTLMDMALETANLIVGSAKVLAEAGDMPYTINTPCFEKIGTFDFAYDQALSIIAGTDELIIAIKELNG